MKAVFISYDHDDQSTKRDVDSIRLNGNNLVEFHDNSLLEPIYNSYGHVNRRMPTDQVSENVSSAIHKLLYGSSKLLVLIGRDTHSSEWVKWEIDTFKSLKMNPDILFMRVNNDLSSGLPSNARSHEIINWDSTKLRSWLMKAR
jgi:hypothetical protein